MNKEIVYTAAGITGTVKQFAALAGISVESMRQRLSRFARGKLPEDRILEGKIGNGPGGNLSWQSLSDRPRTERLRNISQPAPFDTL